MTRVCVVGIGADGWDGLSEPARDRVRAADVVLGGSRQLDLLPNVDGQVRRAWPSPLRDGLVPLLDDLEGTTVVALASGDPMVSGIGTTLVALLGAEAVEVVPAVSSIALARARMRWSAETTDVVSLVGRDPHLVLRWLGPGRRLLVLSSDERTPAVVASLLVEAGYGTSAMTVLADLGGPSEARVDGAAQTWGDRESPRLNVIAISCAAPYDVAPLALVGGLPDDAFEHDGQLTKRDLRASALARLVPLPEALLWDVGAGAGSVGIEWLRAHPSARAIAVERDPERAARIRRNAARLGVPALGVVEGAAPGALADLVRPDAVFVGGGATRPGVLEACWDALRPGGRLVAHGVTLETEALLARWFGEHGGELTRLQVEHAEPIGGFTGWTPARAVVQWAVTKGHHDAESS
ncbi:precorrin-6y C5,15-methyltransferase (decarboxylating) subunit CbiE [Mumia zhuanghuii]|uniref:Precorrin-6y C5,15-methyltransferase (Decarboxylating) subunit CbiE n=2 Tax=Mumia TaxID=1546255 RepID=A0ABW1QS31_9ACTN|nr:MULTISPECIES: precorrin-6y C5,15-methyltransferase (decarboxylating) subunit CbiE [Mumia]KAA1424445.1 precorrin-6y C5,15-methyltransferase (decarboxylating) subunit CbiE [Mumia zhuanghuii]